jgi:hypothetical protein
LNEIFVLSNKLERSKVTLVGTDASVEIFTSEGSKTISLNG